MNNSKQRLCFVRFRVNSWIAFLPYHPFAAFADIAKAKTKRRHGDTEKDENKEGKHLLAFLIGSESFASL
jgi:hypothetical protein